MPAQRRGNRRKIRVVSAEQDLRRYAFSDLYQGADRAERKIKRRSQIRRFQLIGSHQPIGQWGMAKRYDHFQAGLAATSARFSGNLLGEPGLASHAAFLQRKLESTMPRLMRDFSWSILLYRVPSNSSVVKPIFRYAS